jgi:hypothetical protein
VLLEVLTGNGMSKMSIEEVVFWDVALCNLQPPAHTGSSLADFSTLKMEAIRSSETSVKTRPTQRHIPEDDILHSHLCENLKSYKISIVYKC